MATDREHDETTYVVVMNEDEQYSIWPAGLSVPSGWCDVGKHGSKADCLKYIAETWKDMRPLSLRKQLRSVRGREEQA